MEQKKNLIQSLRNSIKTNNSKNNANNIFNKIENNNNSIKTNNSKNINNNINNKKSYVNSSSSPNTPILNIFFFIFSIVIIYLIVKISYYLYLGDCKKLPLFIYLFSFELNPCVKENKQNNKILPFRKEVYHISNQVYNYNEAVCKARSYGSKLATKKQMIDSYNAGANWCSYGWCEGGLAYYPVQERYFNKYPLARFKCRKPGLNGGVFNRQLKFGINLYGVKPKGSIPQKSINAIERKDFCERENVKELVSVNDTDDIISFNKKQWSVYN